MNLSKIPGISAEQMHLILSLLPQGGVYKVFGSRTTDKFRQHSDLDLCVISGLSRAEVAMLQEKFEESDLLFTVDLVIYADCSAQFQAIIDDTGVELGTNTA